MKGAHVKTIKKNIYSEKNLKELGLIFKIIHALTVKIHLVNVFWQDLYFWLSTTINITLFKYKNNIQFGLIYKDKNIHS